MTMDNYGVASRRIRIDRSTIKQHRRGGPVWPPESLHRRAATRGRPYGFLPGGQSFQSSAKRIPPLSIVNYQLSIHRQIPIMIIGLNKQQQISCKCSKNAVIASQCAHWRGNPFPFTRVVFTETLRKSRRLGCGLPRRFAPRNDSAGRNPVIKIHMLIKTDNHNWNLSLN